MVRPSRDEPHGADDRTDASCDDDLVAVVDEVGALVVGDPAVSDQRAELARTADRRERLPADLGRVGDENAGPRGGP